MNLSNAFCKIFFFSLLNCPWTSGGKPQLYQILFFIIIIIKQFTSFCVKISVALTGCGLFIDDVIGCNEAVSVVWCGICPVCFFIAIFLR